MRKLILEEWLSLDGHVADRRGELGFFTSFTPEQNAQSDAVQLRFLETVDTILLGRKTYELFAGFWPTATTAQEIMADRVNSIPKVVISNTRKDAPWGHWAPAEILTGAAADAVAELKARPGKSIVLWGSISLAQSLLQAQLIDELHLQLCPGTTGGGRRLFADGVDPQEWRLQEVRPYPTGIVLLSYRSKAISSAPGA